MLRLTVTVVQVLTEAHVIASVHQEDPLAGTSDALGEARVSYALGDLLDRYDEVTALAIVLERWASEVSKSTSR